MSTTTDKKITTSTDDNKQICGIIMPISAIDGCSEGHWADVREIITQCIEAVGFEANVVSNADEIGVIQKRIIQNVYENPIIVCDVSGKNPNVMFELGLRLAFDKPTVIIKDNVTSYSFDTSPIEHLDYPRDLRYNLIEDFKSRLIDKIKSTYDASKADENYSTFLKHFGEFKVAKLTTKEVTPQEIILDEIKSLRSVVNSFINDPNKYALENAQRIKKINRFIRDSYRIRLLINIGNGTEQDKSRLISEVMTKLRVKSAGHSPINNGKFPLTISYNTEAEFEQAREILKEKIIPYDYEVSYDVV